MGTWKPDADKDECGHDLKLSFIVCDNSEDDCLAMRNEFPYMVYYLDNIIYVLIVFVRAIFDMFHLLGIAGLQFIRRVKDNIYMWGIGNQQKICPNSGTLSH